MEEYLRKDEATLEVLLESSTDFQERRKIRAALRQLKGISLPGDLPITTYSFQPGYVKHSSHSPNGYSSHSPNRHSSHSPNRHSTHSPNRHSSHSPNRQSSHSPNRHSTHSPNRHLSHSPNRQSSHSSKSHLSHSPNRQSSDSTDRHSPTLSNFKTVSENPDQNGNSTSNEVLIHAPSDQSAVPNGINQSDSTRTCDLSPRTSSSQHSLLGNKTYRPKYRSYLYAGSFGPLSPKDARNGDSALFDSHFVSDLSNTLDQDVCDHGDTTADCTEISKLSTAPSLGDIKTQVDSSLDIYHCDSRKFKQNGFSNPSELGSDEKAEQFSPAEINTHDKIITERNNSDEGSSCLLTNICVSNASLQLVEHDAPSNCDQVVSTINEVCENTRSGPGICNIVEENSVESAVEEDNSATIQNFHQEEETLLEKLKQCTDFSERRKIRASIRKLREKREVLEAETINQKPRKACSLVRSVSLDFTRGTTPEGPEESGQDYSSFSDIEELRKLLSGTPDYNEKRRIRLAMRQLRQQDKERAKENENGRTAVSVSEGSPRILRSQSFADWSSSRGVTKESKEAILKTSLGHQTNDDLPLTRSEKPSELYSATLDIKNNSVSVGEEESRVTSTSSEKVWHKPPSQDYKKHSRGSKKKCESYKQVLSPSGPSVSEHCTLTGESEENTTFKQKHKVLSNSSQDESPSLRGRQSVSLVPHLKTPADTSLQQKSCTSSCQVSLTPTEPAGEPSSPRSISSVSFSTSPDSFSCLDSPVNVVEARSDSDNPISSSYSQSKTCNSNGLETCSEWLEIKKKTSALPNPEITDLASTMDLEAAFSEILDFVEQQSEVSDNELGDLDLPDEDNNRPLEVKSDKTPYSDSKMERDGDINCVNGNNSVDRAIQNPVNTVETANDTTTPVKKDRSMSNDVKQTEQRIEVDNHPAEVKRDSQNNIISKKSLELSPIQDVKDSADVEVEDDNTVTVQQESESEKGSRKVTVKTKYNRTPSHSEEQEKDTIVETRLTSPGGNSSYEKEVVKTKRKITSRGSDYFQRNSYVTRKNRQKEGTEHIQHDLCTETENFSVTKGESWGDKSVAKIHLEKPSNHLPPTIQEGLVSETPEEADKSAAVVVLNQNRLNVSKTSSGYGSDDDDREAVAGSLLGRPAGSPEILTPLKDVTTPEGDTAILECTVQASPMPTVTWYKNGQKLDHCQMTESTFDGVTGKITLTLLQTSINSNGEYRCVCHNQLGEADTSCKLVIKRKATKTPKVTSPLSDLNVTEGHSVVLECGISEALQIAWYKDGIIQRNSADFKQTYETGVAKLSICEIFLDDLGQYTCVGKNDLGEARTSCKVNVKESTSESEVVPAFLTRPSNKTAIEGEKVVLECDVIGIPQPVVTWYKDGKLVSNETQLRMGSTFDGRVACLTIEITSVVDSGKFECVAENSAGRVSVDAHLVVKASNRSPIVRESLWDVVGVRGKPLTLQCKIIGSPTPEIMWRKDGRMIGNTKDFKQSYTDGVATMEISEIYPQDGGCYECVGRNVHGEGVTGCQLTVAEISNQTSTSQLKPQASAPLTKPECSPLSKPNSSPLIKSESSPAFTQNTDKSLPKSIKNITQQFEAVSVVEGDNSSPKTSLVRRTSLKGRFEPESKEVNTVRRCESMKLPSGYSHRPVIRNDSGDKKAKDLGMSVGLRRLKTEIDKQMRNENLRLSSGQIPSNGNKTQDTEIPSTSNVRPPSWRENVQCSPGSENIQTKSEDTNRVPSWRDLSVERTENSKPSPKDDDKRPSEWKEVTLKRSQSARLIFERRGESPVRTQLNLNNSESVTAVPSDGRKEIRLNRVESLRVAPDQKHTGLFRSSSLRSAPPRRNGNGVVLELAPPGDRSSNSFVSHQRNLWEGASQTEAMASLDGVDEEQLHKMLQAADDMGERKRIRGKLREISEQKQLELQERMKKREQEQEDVVKMKFRQAEEMKAKKLQAFQDQATKPTSDRLEQFQKGTQDMIHEKQRLADEDKKRTLENFDKLAGKDVKSVTTTTTTKDGKTTTVVKKTETTLNASPGFGGMSYGKPGAEDTAKHLAQQLINASERTSGAITVKTESWSSRDGIVHKSEKTESWGAKPQGARGARAAFQGMDKAANPQAAGKTNALVSVSYAKKAATTLRKNAAAIKEEILNFAKYNTREYQKVEIKNFGSSWNNGLAFCALIHHFYPDSFDFDKLDPKNRRYNFTLAFDTAEKVADIAPLLDVDDMVKMKTPDWKCVFCYVQSFYRKLRDHENNKAMAAPPSAEQ